MNITIYQINTDRDDACACFESLQMLAHYGETVKPEIYDRVFEGDVDCRSLEEVFQKFNLNQPEGYRGRSMSVSDVVEVKDPETGSSRCWFCDSVGFEEIEFDTAQTHPLPEDTIRVVLVEPGRKARIAEIGASLEGYYEAIDTDIIQAIYPFEEEVCIVCDEEGKLKGAPLNRALRDHETKEIYDIIAGTFFVCSCKDASFGSLSEDEQRRYLELYKWPEAFYNINGKVVAVPLKPQDRGEAR